MAQKQTDRIFGRERCLCWVAALAIAAVLGMSAMGVATAQKLPRPAAPGDDLATLSRQFDELYRRFIELRSTGKYDDAISVGKKVQEVARKRFGVAHKSYALILNNLALALVEKGAFSEAELLYREALAIYSRVLKPDDIHVAVALVSMAELYRRQGRFTDAELMYRRGLSIIEKALGATHEGTAAALKALAELYRQQGRLTDAERLFQRALAILEKGLGATHLRTGAVLIGLADVYRQQGRFVDAEAPSRRALAIIEKSLGAMHPSTASALVGLAETYRAQGRFADAEPLFQRALATFENALGATHRSMATTLDILAVLKFQQQKFAEGLPIARRAVDIVTSRQALRSEVAQEKKVLGRPIAIAYRARQGSELDEESFGWAQWLSRGETSEALAQMAVRIAARSPTLASMVRQRQDARNARDETDKRLVAAFSVAQPTEALRATIADLDKRLATLDLRLSKEFPDYVALVTPKPLDFASVQSFLGEDEALVVYAEIPNLDVFVWVVTKSATRWAKIEFDPKTLRMYAEILRCGLDRALWNNAGSRAACEAFGLPAPQNANAPLHYHMDVAQSTYTLLFGPIADLVHGKHLLVVPSTSFTQVPFQALVTQSPSRLRHASTPDEFRGVTFLGARQPITVLPSVASFKSLRQFANSNRAEKSLIGFGNPLIDGNPNVADHVTRARQARERQRCGHVPSVFASLANRGRVIDVTPQGENGLADIGQLKAQLPLPETADELCEVARKLGIPESEIRLGARATESEIKALSRSGELAKYRILHFATHGALAGELKGSAEPGLILTPPAKATEADDGYLAASEVAQLKLNADWVILSACNTAAGGAKDAEALSGLARAFFYAGARALLVSHWAVDSDATVKLVTTAVDEMQRDPTIGRAEAMRRAMTALVEKGAPHEAHPSFWAPFVVVGDGAGR